MTTSKRVGRWRQGESGNPAGRRPGTGEVAALRAAISEHVPAIIEKLVEQAKAGDVAASRLLLERIVPPLKAAEQPTPMRLPNGPLADQGRAVLAAAGAGELAPGQAAQLLSGLGALAKLIETDELAARIAALEAKHLNT
ncbi:DUF5681 domain-containing protein [Variovorax sp. PBL-E5]|uniref:DUF5681 domain-containing protein n=1 Tax=Variovorax sp. PBL-E5 TaxID=434014 RepID=UPI0013168D36|nr:DUF5681 domain-containing protein [Variovorax sp. PBL-E5]VTU24840.1 hypothetical protein E5CHR_01876 [Variovorax sp. PBL-E5]